MKNNLCSFFLRRFKKSLRKSFWLNDIIDPNKDKRKNHSFSFIVVFTLPKGILMTLRKTILEMWKDTNIK